MPIPGLSELQLPYDITCGTFPAFLCFPASFEIRNTNNSTYRYYYTSLVHIPSGITLLDHNARPAQISPAIYSPAAQRSAVRSRAEPCGAVPCPSLRCCVAALCAFFRALSSTGYNVLLCTEYYFSSFFFFCMYLIFHGPPFFPPRNSPPYCRSERNTGNKSTQHS